MDPTLNKYAAPNIRGMPPSEQKRLMAGHKTSMVKKISEDPAWNPGYAAGRKNPWHPNMDDIQFYL
jgi:hypothetical protein